MRSLWLLCALLALLLMSLEGSHQATAATNYSVTLSYSVVGGGSPTPPEIQFRQGGLLFRETLSTHPTTYTMDLGSTWNVNSLLGGSNSTQRWALSGSNVGTGSAQTLVLLYYKQVYVSFSFTWAGDGQIFSLNLVNYTSFGKPTLVYPPFSAWADYNTHYTYGNRPNYLPPGARWYVVGQDGVITSPGAVVAGYFEQYSLNFKVDYLGPDTFRTASLEVSYAGAIVNHTLSAAGGSYWIDYNSSFVAQPAVYGGSGSYRWSLQPLADPVAFASMNVTLQYVEQFPLTVQYTVNGGAEPSPPLLTATADRQVATLQLRSTDSVTWVDSGSAYQISSQLQGSTPNERWYTGGVAGGVANGPASVTLVYFHQVLIPLSYSVVGGGAIPAIDAEYTSFGSLISVTVGTDPVNQWADYGTALSVPATFVGGSQFERWILANPPTYPIATPGSIALLYYHQYSVPLLYVISGQGSPPAAMLNGTEFGAPRSWSLASGASTWLDSGSRWSVSSALSGALQGERWEGIGVLSGTVSGGTVIGVTYQHEYFVSLTSNPPGAGALSGEGWVPAGGALGISTTPNSGYSFAGWQGSGLGSYSGKSENYSGVVSAPVQEVAEYNVGIFIHVSGRGTVSVEAGSHTVSVSNEMTLYVPPGTTVLLVANSGLLESFLGWQGVPGGTTGAVSFKAEAPGFAAASFGINQVEALGLITLCFGGAAFGILFVGVKRRSKSIFRSVKHGV